MFLIGLILTNTLKILTFIFINNMAIAVNGTSAMTSTIITITTEIRQN